MASIKKENITIDVSEDVMMAVGLTATGEVKMMRPVGGDANNEHAMMELARPMFSEDKIASVAIIPVHYIFTPGH
jgi:hypothetical protein